MSKPKEFDEIIHCERIGDSLLYNHYVVGELVRCKDCTYWEQAKADSGSCNRAFEITAYASDYCSYGERKDEVEE